VAAACSSSMSPLGFQHRTDYLPHASTTRLTEGSQNHASQHESMEAWAPGNDDLSVNHSSGGAGQKKRDCNPNSSNDHKRKQFSEWLYSQSDAHHDVRGFSSAGCTPVCLSRCSSAVDVTVGVDCKLQGT
jgi:hypothetical protein